jgi:DNA mismatch repair ATPase MutS
MRLSHNTYLVEDLSIKSIFKKIDHTITEFGKRKLYNRLQFKYNTYDDLIKMTQINELVGEDPQYVDKLSNLLLQVKDVESDIFSWIIDSYEKSIKSLIFDNYYLDNRVFLTISNKMKFSTVFIVIFFYFIMYWILYWIDIPIDPVQYCKSIYDGYIFFAQFLMCNMFSDPFWIERSALALVIVYIGYQIYLMIQSIKTCYDHYVKCDQFNDLYQNIVEFIDLTESILDMDKYVANNEDLLREVIDRLRYYFDKDSGLGFSLVSKLSKDSYLQDMELLGNYVGRVDMIQSIYQLRKDGYVVPIFIQNKFPILQIDKLWNPIIALDKRVVNSVNFDSMNPNLMIVTGPNKSGKSTYMRTIMLCVYLAHSIGVTCCDSVRLTPFKNLFTYMNVPDCIGRESLFEAEINRTYQYIEQTEDLNGFSLGCIDELFTGTNPKEGMAGSYAIINRISNNPIGITILSTHFYPIINFIDKKLVTLKKFTAIKNGDSYDFDYIAKDGSSDQCIAVNLLKEKGFDKKIIDDCMWFCENYPLIMKCSI